MTAPQQIPSFTLSCAKVRGKKSNTYYPNEQAIHNLDELKKAARYDHTPGFFKDSHRSKASWYWEKCIVLDVDNTTPGDVTTPADIERDFPGVGHYIIFSRNHNRPKVKDDGKGEYPAAPRFHIYFPISSQFTGDEMDAFIKRAIASQPYFDPCCDGRARFIFGVENPEGKAVPGDLTLDDFLAQHTTPVANTPAVLPASTGAERIIPAGERHDHMVPLATKLLKKYGPDGIEQAREAYDLEAEHLEAGFPQDELERIWKDQLAFVQTTIWNKPGYLTPAEYAVRDFPVEVLSFKLSDLSEIAEGQLFAENTSGVLLWNPSLDWLVWDGCRFAPDSSKARLLAQKFTGKQHRAAQADVQQAAGAAAQDTENTELAARAKKAKALLTFVTRCRSTNGLNHLLIEAAPHLACKLDDLDADPFALNTPAGIVDLRTGELRPSDPAALCTKATAVGPCDDGAELWNSFLDTICCGDTELADHLQTVAGMAALGQVFTETLLLATGDGGNGKSTFFNTLARVLGDYATSVRPALLLTGNANNGAELAALRGVRLALAAETEEGQRLDGAAVKGLVSTDRVAANPKYKDPFSFTPSHTLVLYTNFLPRVGSSDRGTWSRLTVLPFNAHLRDTAGERKDYAEILFTQAGGAVLAWMIEGARRFIANGYKLTPPTVVREALAEYQKSNDWLGDFLEECCELGESYTTGSNDLYQRYTAFCQTSGADYKRNNKDFANALKSAGFERKRTAKGWQVCGMRLKSGIAPQ